MKNGTFICECHFFCVILQRKIVCNSHRLPTVLTSTRYKQEMTYRRKRAPKDSVISRKA